MRNPAIGLSSVYFLCLVTSFCSLAACGNGAAPSQGSDTQTSAALPKSTGVGNASSTSSSGNAGMAGDAGNGMGGNMAGTPNSPTNPNTPGKPAAPGNPDTPVAPPAVVSGGIAGNTFRPSHAMFAEGMAPDGQMVLAIKLSDQPDDCAMVTQQQHRAGAKSLWLRVAQGDLGKTWVPLVPESLPGSTGTFYALDANCGSTVPDAQAWATSGTVTMQTIDPNEVVGHLAAVFGAQGDTVTADFVADPCPALAALITDPNQSRTCLPAR